MNLPGGLGRLVAAVTAALTLLAQTTTPHATVPLAAGDLVGLRVLVIGADRDDPGLAAWTSQLDQVGVPYDTWVAGTAPLTGQVLLRPDGAGRYQAILLASGALLRDGGTGAPTSGLDPQEWRALWEYERVHGVRQVALSGGYGTYPEDLCLRAGSEGAVGSTPLPARLTPAGAALFDYLNPDVEIPIASAYVYRSSIAAGCAATPLLTLDGDVVGVTSTAPDGRERAALTFSPGTGAPRTGLLGYGLLRWATRGVLLGEHRHWLEVDVDDWFRPGDERLTSGTLVPGAYRTTAGDVTDLVDFQRSLRQEYPLADAFRLNLAYNGGYAGAGGTGDGDFSDDPLAVATVAARDEFRWLDHGYLHRPLNDADYPTSRGAIADNLAAGQRMGLRVPTTVLKTPEYSGLGTYPADPADTIDPPTDHGLGSSNVDLLRAARDLGVRYLHGNMSFASQRPGCFNCAVRHPLAPDLLVVPDWPTDLGYFATTPDEETAFYNAYYGPTGRFPYWPVDLTYQQVIDEQAEIGLAHVVSGRAYTHTMHAGNVRRYAERRSLAGDWITAVVARYGRYYRVPLLSPDWPDLGRYTERRTAHFAALAAGADAVWDRAAGTVTITGTSPGTLFLTGADPAGDGGGDGPVTDVDRYGSDTIATVTFPAGAATVVTARPAPGADRPSRRQRR